MCRLSRAGVLWRCRVRPDRAATARSVLDGLYKKVSGGSALNADDIRAAAAFATGSVEGAGCCRRGGGRNPWAKIIYNQK